MPLGITIVGGLLLSQLLTLYTVPVIYLYFDKLAQQLKQREIHAKGTGNMDQGSGNRDQGTGLRDQETASVTSI